jgi:hypothetical protein
MPTLSWLLQRAQSAQQKAAMQERISISGVQELSSKIFFFLASLCLGRLFTIAKRDIEA